LVRQVYDSTPAISKIYYKTAPNDTVKGFDAVHVVGAPDELELWLGEAKFYSNLARAVRDASAEVKAHLERDYLRTEFLLIGGKLEKGTPHYENLSKLLDDNASLDEVFARVCIPVLLTYDSDCLGHHNKVDANFKNAFEAEVRAHYVSFRASLATKKLPSDVRVHLFLLPLSRKADLITQLHQRLKAWQQI